MRAGNAGLGKDLIQSRQDHSVHLVLWIKGSLHSRWLRAGNYRRDAGAAPEYSASPFWVRRLAPAGCLHHTPAACLIPELNRPRQRIHILPQPD